MKLVYLILLLIAFNGYGQDTLRTKPGEYKLLPPGDYLYVSKLAISGKVNYFSGIAVRNNKRKKKYK